MSQVELGFDPEEEKRAKDKVRVACLACMGHVYGALNASSKGGLGNDLDSLLGAALKVIQAKIERNR